MVYGNKWRLCLWIFQSGMVEGCRGVGWMDGFGSYGMGIYIICVFYTFISINYGNKMKKMGGFFFLHPIEPKPTLHPPPSTLLPPPFFYFHPLKKRKEKEKKR